jgi:hypothetical protein
VVGAGDSDVVGDVGVVGVVVGVVVVGLGLVVVVVLGVVVRGRSSTLVRGTQV